jgi:hypothetical protein
MTRRRAAGKTTFVATTLVVWLLCAGAAFAASPTPDPIVGDPRSSGQGPGLVGDPLFAVVAVVTIGVVSLVATLAYVRLTARRGD